MAMQEIVVRLSSQMVRELDLIALGKKIKRERALDHLIRDALRRERVWAEFDRKRKSPEWRRATKRLAEFRKHIKPIPESELDEEIQEAITAVRAQKK
ncbi:MAG: hypothetical protein HZC40_17645 [Chloroflexi bacterium]|nr:hypothetical protein [Chloroflexota bacterium]